MIGKYFLFYFLFTTSHLFTEEKLKTVKHHNSVIVYSDEQEKKYLTSIFDHTLSEYNKHIPSPPNSGVLFSSSNPQVRERLLQNSHILEELKKNLTLIEKETKEKGYKEMASLKPQHILNMSTIPLSANVHLGFKKLQLPSKTTFSWKSFISSKKSTSTTMSFIITESTKNENFFIRMMIKVFKPFIIPIVSKSIEKVKKQTLLLQWVDASSLNPAEKKAIKLAITKKLEKDLKDEFKKTEESLKEKI